MSGWNSNNANISTVKIERERMRMDVGICWYIKSKALIPRHGFYWYKSVSDGFELTFSRWSLVLNFMLQFLDLLLILKAIAAHFNSCALLHSRCLSATQLIRGWILYAKEFHKNILVLVSCPSVFLVSVQHKLCLLGPVVPRVIDSWDKPVSFSVCKTHCFCCDRIRSTVDPNWSEEREVSNDNDDPNFFRIFGPSLVASTVDTTHHVIRAPHALSCLWLYRMSSWLSGIPSWLTDFHTLTQHRLDNPRQLCQLFMSQRSSDRFMVCWLHRLSLMQLFSKSI